MSPLIAVSPRPLHTWCMGLPQVVRPILEHSWIHAFTLHRSHRVSCTMALDVTWLQDGKAAEARYLDGQWYAARVIQVSHKRQKCRVQYVDFGSAVDVVPFADLRPPSNAGSAALAQEPPDFKVQSTSAAVSAPAAAAESTEGVLSVSAGSSAQSTPMGVCSSSYPCLSRRLGVPAPRYRGNGHRGKGTTDSGRREIQECQRSGKEGGGIEQSFHLSREGLRAPQAVGGGAWSWKAVR